MTAGRAHRCRETGWWLTNVSRLWNLGSPVWWLCPLVLTTEGLPGGCVRPPSSPSRPFPPGPGSPPSPLLSALFSSPPSGGSGFTELWDKEVQTCLTFLHPPCGNGAGSLSTKCWCMPFALAYSVFPMVAFLWNLSVWRLWGLKGRGKVTEEAREMISAELCGQRAWVQSLYIWQIDFCQQLSSVRLPVFEEEDQIRGSMLCAGWTPKRT